MMFKCLIITLLVGVAVAYPRPRAYPRPQQQIQQVGLPPHLLRQYLAEAQQQRESTPIYEAEAQAQGPPQPQGGPVTQFRFSSPVQRLVERVQQPQYPQTVQYPQPAPQAAGRPRPRPLQGLQQQEEEEPQYPDDPNPSYQFGFDVNDDQFTNYQNRKEQRDGNVIKGSYSVVDSDGFIRTVTYTADPKEGFKAEVTRQPTDIVVKIPTPKPQDQQIYRPQQQQQQQQQPQPQREQQPQQYYRYQ